MISVRQPHLPIWITALVLSTSIPFSVLGEEAIKLEWKAFQPGTVFYQTQEMTATQTMTIQEQIVKQKQKLVYHEKWTAQEKTKEGHWVVLREIVGGEFQIDIGGNVIKCHLDEANSSENLLSHAVRVLLGLKLKYTIRPDLSVVDVQGQQEFLERMGTSPMIQAHLNDVLLQKDMLKQLAESSWVAFPPDGALTRQPWTKTVRWGVAPMSAFSIRFAANYEGKEERTGLDCIRLKRSAMTYVFPDPRDRAPLSFIVWAAEIEGKDLQVVAWFDRTKGRFAEVTTSMKFNGSLRIQIGDTESGVIIEQTQETRTITFDDNPVSQRKQNQRP